VISLQAGPFSLFKVASPNHSPGIRDVQSIPVFSLDSNGARFIDLLHARTRKQRRSRYFPRNNSTGHEKGYIGLNLAPESAVGPISFIKELGRRNVIRVGVAYVVASWLLLQITDVLITILELPGSAGKPIFIFLVVGFIPVLIFSWVYEMTPDGLKKDSGAVADESTNRYTARKLDRITIVLLIIVGGLVVFDRFLPEPGEQAAAVTSENETLPVPALEQQHPASVKIADDRQSIAVMPFVNMSDDKSNEYFSDGISEELLNVLVRVRSLRVPSRTSSFTFKGSDKRLSEIGRELGVEHVLEGSVRKAGDRIRVTAQLIEVATDTHLWSETYTRELDDIFAVQDEIAQAIVDALQLTLSGADRQSLSAHSTSNAKALDEYMIGRHLWNQRTPESLLASIEHLTKAIELDPEFDQAWVALADTYVIAPEYIAGTVDEYIPLAREAVNKALAINPDSARALATSGYYKATYDYDWEGANEDLKRVVMLVPDYALAHMWYGEILNLQGHLDEALLELQLARSADPLSAVIRHIPGYFNLWAFRFDQAEVHFMGSLALGGQPFRWTLHNLDMLNTLRGEYDEARRRAIQLAELEGFDPAADLARIDAIENPALKAHALDLLEQRQDMGDSVFGKALQYTLLGEYESALDSLEKSLAAGDPYVVAMNYMRIFDPMREDPRFRAMLKEMNFLP
jgi:TolB-like protein